MRSEYPIPEGYSPLLVGGYPPSRRVFIPYNFGATPLRCRGFIPSSQGGGTPASRVHSLRFRGFAPPAEGIHPACRGGEYPIPGEGASPPPLDPSPVRRIPSEFSEYGADGGDNGRELPPFRVAPSHSGRFATSIRTELPCNEGVPSYQGGYAPLSPPERTFIPPKFRGLRPLHLGVHSLYVLGGPGGLAPLV